MCGREWEKLSFIVDLDMGGSIEIANVVRRPRVTRLRMCNAEYKIEKPQ